MRRVTVQVAHGSGGDVADVARDCGGLDVALVEAQSDRGETVELVTFSIGNAQLGSVLSKIDDIAEPHVSFEPRGVIALRPPAGEAAAQVVDVQPRSPIEVYLSGLQSVGSWRAFLSYAAAAGIIVWIGLFTERMVLLVAAMLIAPFAGPAMNAALATARGDLDLFWRSLVRYVAAIALAILTAFVLSVVMSEKIATGLMVQESMISSVAVILPVTAGAAGALNLCQSERNSLVSGAATGMLIAASLAPPAGIVGMAAAIGEWPMAKSGAFLILLQIAGINLSGAIVFRIYGVGPSGARLKRGESGLPRALGAASLAVLAGLVAWQVITAPNLQRSSVAQRATQEARETIENSGMAKVIKLDGQFTRANIPGQNTLLVTGYVQPAGHGGGAVKRNLESSVEKRLRRDYAVEPIVDLTLVGQ